MHSICISLNACNSAFHILCCFKEKIKKEGGKEKKEGRERKEKEGGRKEKKGEGKKGGKEGGKKKKKPPTQNHFIKIGDPKMNGFSRNALFNLENNKSIIWTFISV